MAAPPDPRPRALDVAEVARRRPPGWWRWFRDVGAILLVVVLAEYVVLPKVLQARSELSIVRDVSVWALLVGLLLEAASLVAYTCLTQALLQGSRMLRFGVQLRLDLIGFGLSRVLPGSGAASAAVRYRLMVERGVHEDRALSLAAVQYLSAAMALLGISTVAALATVPTAGATTVTVTLVVVTVLFAGAVGWWGTRRGESRREVASRLGAMVRSVTDKVREALRDPELRRTGLAWATANWLLDAACLWVCLRAYGTSVPVPALLLAYGVANLLGSIPLTPGGLGVIEGTLIPALVLAGGASAPVVIGVLTWRVLQYWLPIPVAAVSWLSLRWSPGSSSPPPDDRGP